MGTFSDQSLNVTEAVVGDTTSQDIKGGTYMNNLKRFSVGQGKTAAVRIAEGAMYVHDGTNDRVIVGFYSGRF